MCISSDVEGFDGSLDRWIVGSGMLLVGCFGEKRSLCASGGFAYQEPYEVLYNRMVKEELEVDSVDVGECASLSW